MPPTHRSFPARLDALPEVLAYIDDSHAYIDSNTLKRIRIVIEELFTNSVKYGYKNNSMGKVWVGLSIDPNGITLHFEDQAPQFNPLEGLESVTKKLENTLETRDEGGIGRLLVKKLTDSSCYSYKDGRNLIKLSFQL